MMLRPAVLSDIDDILRWRNDPETVAACRRDRPLTRGEVEAYLFGGYVAERDGAPVGLLRATPLFEVSWMVAPEHRRRGIGCEMVATVRQSAVAFIRPGNIASQKIAAATGFARVEGLEIWRKG